MLGHHRGATPFVLSFVSLLACADSARAQSAGAAVDLPDIVVTADRRAEPIGRSASAISVLTREELQSFNPTSLVDALRSVPGLDVSETGGPGSTTAVRLRGANSGQTLVLIDGIRVNDPVSASGEFDFSTLLPTAIDRIEVLRGPQSALYGSDAIGGVINITTRSGRGEPRFESRTEAGAYGTVNTSTSASGSIGPWSFAANGGGQKSAGFSRYGYRVGQLERKFPFFEPDGFNRYGGYGRLGYDAGEGVKLEMGMMSSRTSAEYDAASSTLPRNVVATGAGRIFPDTPANAIRQLSQIWARATAETGPVDHSFQVYANQTDRDFRDVSYRTSTALATTTSGRTEFRGDRVGTEYQGDLKFDAFGSLTFGGRIETEKATTFSTPLLPTLRARSRTLEAEQTTKSVFALYQLPIGERIILSAGGRHDEVDARSFDTWRATGAFLIPETGTKLRASGGTGGKAPTLYQLFEPTFGNAALSPETSIGWDAGVDQTLFDGRVTLSATVFGNRFNDLIEFNSATSRYFNVARARTSGVELEGGIVLWPELLRMTGNYTYLDSEDERTGLSLQRRPRHSGRIGFPITPAPGLLIEPRITMVSQRFSGNNETLPLVPYARLDIYAEYKIDNTWKVFGRVENVTDTRYQEILNYGTTGRAAYAGLSVTW
ncbi:MAG: hypothetical protein JWR08_347 [Enterovirga sp.]|nr:hypothetical protein [Enterovirga sp.]